MLTSKEFKLSEIVYILSNLEITRYIPILDENVMFMSNEPNVTTLANNIIEEAKKITKKEDISQFLLLKIGENYNGWFDENLWNWISKNDI